jgi:hypothetical protein
MRIKSYYSLIILMDVIIRLSFGVSPAIAGSPPDVATTPPIENKSLDPTVKPCRPSTIDRNSDLCAQWRAADAATAAAEASWWQVWLSLVSLIIGLFTLMSAVAAALFAKRAASASLEAVSEARHANKISENAMQVGNRAWISFEHWILSKRLDIHGNVIGAIICAVYKNVGPSPALESTIFVGSHSTLPNYDIDKVDFFANADRAALSSTTMFPHNPMQSGPITISKEQLEWTVTHKRDLFIVTQTKYKDIFSSTEKITQLVARFSFENLESFDNFFEKDEAGKKFFFQWEAMKAHSLAT